MKPIGMIVIPIEKGLLYVEATRISHMVLDARTDKATAFVHLKSGEEFAIELGDGDLWPSRFFDQYNEMIEAAS